ncbi:MAG: hypothetical protein JO219_12150 [Candidatus Eremiobacteraeota bacterium]|nr:hypothetical protein [Candidatus Eremiobacteraeota bacterium]MBV8366266.1 hypothetical protein [Candidatus Eremiobacteraeota bacterium]
MSIAARLICCGWLLMTSGAAPVAADSVESPAFIASAVLPRVVYYGDCALELPTVVTFRSDFSSTMSLRVTARYDYVPADVRLPESTILAVHMAQISALRYSGSVDVAHEAFAYLRGGDGILRYQVTAIDARAASVSGESGAIAVHACPVSLGAK